jgi:hypothetical protein
MVMKKDFGGDSPLRQGAGKSFWTLPISGRRRRWLAISFWKIARPFRVFSSRRIYRRRAASGSGTRGHTPWWRGPGAGCADLGCGWSLAPLLLCFGLRLVSGKIGTSAFVSSNSENISCVAFLKHKNSRKQGTSTVASC